MLHALRMLREVSGAARVVVVDNASGDDTVGAVRALHPEVGVVGSIGSQSQGWGTSPNTAMHIWSFGPSAIWPILDFGALDA